MKAQPNCNHKGRGLIQLRLLTSGVRRCERRRSDQATEHAMSWPQHMGDLILPWPFGHFDTCTEEPSSRWMVSLTSGASQAPHVALTDIPHTAHS